MARGRRPEIPPCSKTYGFPIYCAASVPLDRIFALAAPTTEKENEKKEGGGGSDDSESQKPDPDRLLVALGGGGGEGRSGVPNVLLIAEFNFTSRSLSDQPVYRLGTDADVPYRMAMHPRGDGIICSFPKCCRSFIWDLPEGKESIKLVLKSSEKTLTSLEDVGMQLALAFNAEGSMLATGGEDGHLRVFKWPTLENVLDQGEAHTTVKDLDFSSSGKFLVSLGSGGPCRIWDLTSSTAMASLPRENGETFGFCRFLPTLAENQILFVTAMHGDHGKIISWSTVSWKRVGSRRIARNPISAFSISSEGKHLAVGTIEGEIIILRASDMQVESTVRKAHLGIVTALAFSQDSRALVSTSFDSNARVTVLESTKSSGLNLWFVVLVLVVAVLVYYMKSKGFL